MTPKELERLMGEELMKIYRAKGWKPREERTDNSCPVRIHPIKKKGDRKDNTLDIGK